MKPAMSAPNAKGDETCGSRRRTQASSPMKANSADENAGSMRPLRINCEAFIDTIKKEH
ncbi:hypothetical protein [Parapedobacter tibetensis]|uniref:hypothetical protein n=1 Tax=Parapedobacter tibetensis TaxID=2972951 RepID=UPI00214D7827|nr:hypothetical protein [Parapedobacter tibetensis]